MPRWGKRHQDVECNVLGGAATLSALRKQGGSALALRLAVPSLPFTIAVRDSCAGPRPDFGEYAPSFGVSEGCLQQYSRAADLGPSPFGRGCVYAVAVPQFMILVDQLYEGFDDAIVLRHGDGAPLERVLFGSR